MKKKQKSKATQTVKWTISLGPTQPEGLVIWTVAKILGKVPTMHSEEAVNEWIKKKNKKDKSTYLAVPFLFPTIRK